MERPPPQAVGPQVAEMASPPIQSSATELVLSARWKTPYKYDSPCSYSTLWQLAQTADFPLSSLS